MANGQRAKEAPVAAEHVIRASDSDREHAVEALRGQYAEGRLTLEEFDERTSAAYAAKTWTDLRELTSDLPVRLSFGPASAAATPGPGAGAPGAWGQRWPGARAWRFVPLLPDGYSFTTTITLCMLASGLTVVYHPVAYGRRIALRLPAARGSSHLRHVVTGLAGVGEDEFEPDHLQAAGRLLSDQ